MNDIYYPFLTAMVLFSLYKTDAVVEYMKLFRVDKLFWVPLFEKAEEKNPELDYWDYLRLEHDCFFVRLITCPICVGFWVNVFCLFYYTNPFFFFMNWWLSYFLFFVLSWVMTKSYE